MYEYLPVFYFKLFASYVFAIRMLYEPIFDKNLIETSKKILQQYVEALEDSFGNYAYDYTVHAHLHLADQVKQHGPLHCNSQFVFEVNFYVF